MISRKRFLPLLGAVVAPFITLPAQADEPADKVTDTVSTEAVLVASDPYVRAMPPGRRVTAAFFQLQNPSDKDCQLVDVVADRAASAEIHTHLHENGVMKMRQVKQLPVPAQSDVAFVPGGYHVMLFGTEPLAVGETVEITLQFTDCQPFSFSAPVRGMRR